MQFIDLNRRVRAPAPQDGLAKLPRIDLVPAPTARRHLKAEFAHLIGELIRQRLAHGVVGRIPYVEGGAHAITAPNTILATEPPRLLEQTVGLLAIEIDLHVVARPRHAVADRIRDLAVPIKHLLDHGLTVDAAVDGTTDRKVAGHVIAHLIRNVALEHLGLTGRYRRKRDTTRVDRLVRHKLIPIEG
mgnify:CR=1 FL=1